MNTPKINSELVRKRQILFIEADKNYTLFHLKNGEIVTSSYTLKIHEECLDQHQFLRISRSIIVNCQYLEGIKSKGQRNSVVVLTNGEEKAIARRRYKEVLKLYSQIRTLT